MSSRVLKKLGLDGDTDIPKLKEVVNKTDENISSSSFSKEKFNRYNLLNDNSQSESEVKEDDDNETTESFNAVENTKDFRDTRRKKKKKKRKSNKQQHNARSSKDNPEDEVERSIREVNELFGFEIGNYAQPVCSTEIYLAKEMSSLKVEARHLNPNNEFKRMFGSKVVNTSVEFKRKARGRSIKNSVIVLPKDTWIPIRKQGISMKLIEKINNYSYFNFEHNDSYQEVQKQFLDAVSGFNIDDIVMIVEDHPYHVDTLIQLSELCKIREDHAMAVEYAEKAVYALEMGFHPSFNVCSGECRLSYLRQENRAFYIAVMKHIEFVGQRACYRTALELCKMVLSLSPIEDPLAIILCIDYYALRANEYKWLIDFIDAWNSTRNLLKLPNYKYSLAVAHWYLNNFEEADTCIKEALMLFPSALIPLADKCSIQLDSKVATHSFFTTFSSTTETKSLKCLIQLYVERCHHVWKNSELLPWLERNVHEILTMVENKNPEITECQTKRMTWFKPSLPIDIKRHLVTCDFTDILLLANEGMSDIILPFNPYPPTNSVNLYSNPRRSTVNNSRRTGILASFFQALNPNIYNEDLDDRNELNELAEEIGEMNQELRRGLRSIVISIRGLLTNFDAESNRRDDTSTEGEGVLEGDAEDSETDSVEDAAS